MTVQSNQFANFYKAVAQLEALIPRETRSYMNASYNPQHPTKQKFFLARAQNFFNLLGNPEHGDKKWRPRYIHVAGTAGKGSTAMMVYEILRAAGKKVGIFTSPYVTSPIENIQTNGKLIAPDDFAATVTELMPVVAKIVKKKPELLPSYAEVFFAIAIKYFQKQRCAWIVVETGCGGRFDYTNIIPSPAITIITNISLEHTNILGDTIKKIAWQKAGVIKKGSTIILTEQNKAAQQVFKQTARQVKAKSIHYVRPRKKYRTILAGEHQQWNAAAAAAATKVIGITEKNTQKGIKTACLPARLELMQKEPAVIIDGAHSSSKIIALAHFLLAQKQRSRSRWRKLHVIFAAKESKNLVDLITPLAPLADQVIITTFQLVSFGSHNPQATKAAWQKINPHVDITIEPSPRKALTLCLKNAAHNDLVLITGSLYLAGIVRQHWISVEEILQNQSSWPKKVA